MTALTAPAGIPVANATSTPPTTRVISYTVVARDTLWDIATRFGLSVNELIGANPQINPDVIKPGAVLNIPAPGEIDVSKVVKPTAAPAQAAQTKARVSATGGNLRLRRTPSTSGRIIARLPALTPLTVLNRSADGVWLQVRLNDGRQGWVMSRYVDSEASGAVKPAQVSAQVSAQTQGEQPIQAAQITFARLNVKGGAAQALPMTLPRAEPYLINFTTRAKEIYQAGVALGNQPNVFSVIGDSNSASPVFLKPFDAGNYDLGDYGYLQDTIQYFKGSFGQTSAAVMEGLITVRLYTPLQTGNDVCQSGESLMGCEYRLRRPSIALILIGTNDFGMWQSFERNYRPIIEDTIARGVLPVLITKGDNLETIYGGPPGYIDAAIARLSQEYAVPLLDLKQALTQFNALNGGFGPDGYHFSLPSDARAAHFTGEYLRYGYNIRNLTALQALDAIRRLVIQS